MEKTIFAKRLYEARTTANLTQEELATLSGVPSGTISSYERANGKVGQNPSLVNVLKITRALNVSMDWLCGTEITNPQVKITDFLRLVVRLNDAGQSIIVDNPNFADNITAQLLPNIFNSIDREDYSLAEEISAQEISNFEYKLNVFHIKNNHIEDFFTEWNKIKNLYQSGTIDRSLYDLWLEKQFKTIDEKQAEELKAAKKQLNQSGI